MTTQREVFMVCFSDGRPVSRAEFDTREAAEAERRNYRSGHYYHVRPARITTEILGSPPEPWFTVVNSTGAHHV